MYIVEHSCIMFGVSGSLHIIITLIYTVTPNLRRKDYNVVN